MKKLTLDKGEIRFFWVKNVVPILLVIFAIGMAFINRTFATWDNISNIINEFAIYGITACAMTTAIICGEFDLSCASIFGWSTVLFCLTCTALGVLPAFLITLLCGAAFGAFNGVLVAKVRMPAFIATLGTMTAIKGLAYVVTDAQPIKTENETLYAISKFNIGGLSIVPLVFIVIVVLFIWVLKFTKFGRAIYATGGNYEVARLSGINVRFYKFIVFVLLGVCAALSGIMYGSRIMAGWAPYGADLALYCVTVTVIGGTSLMGGNGGVHRTIIGILFMAVIFNALTLLGVGGSMQKFVRGIVLISVIMFDAITSKRHKA
jgi:ribose transport system permease protein